MSESIHLIIIGAGLAGLSAGISTKIANPNHAVTILESVRELAEIGVSTLSFPHSVIRSHISPGRPPANTKCNAALQALGHLRATRPKGHFPNCAVST